MEQLIIAFVVEAPIADHGVLLERVDRLLILLLVDDDFAVQVLSLSVNDLLAVSLA